MKKLDLEPGGARCLLVYSSVSGNTRRVAEAIREVLPASAIMRSVEEAPAAEDFDFVALGFWVRRGAPDPRMAAYMRAINGKNVAFFGTLAAWPDSPHAKGVIEAAAGLLAGNRIIGSFLCQGRLAPGLFEARSRGKSVNERHPMTEERRARLLEAMKHPDARDLSSARAAFAEFFSQAREIIHQEIC